MTQILIPDTNLLRDHEARVAVDALLAALDVAETIPTTRTEVLTIAGQQAPAYGALIRIDHQRLTGDRRGPAWEKRWAAYAAPEDAANVVLRMLAEGRQIFGIRAERGMLGGTVQA